jgi:predicted  nucleic acid-binding Zn-ribbon protein
VTADELAGQVRTLLREITVVQTQNTTLEDALLRANDANTQLTEEAAVLRRQALAAEAELSDRNALNKQLLAKVDELGQVSLSRVWS